MKKFMFICAALALMLLKPFAAAAAENAQYTFYTNGAAAEDLCEGETSLEFKLTADNDIKGALIIAAAYEDGSLKYVSSARQDLTAGENTVKTGVTLVDEDTDTFKVCVWEEKSQRPLTDGVIEIKRLPRLKSLSVAIGGKVYTADIDGKSKTASLNLPIYYVSGNTNIKEIASASGYENTPSAAALSAYLKTAAPTVGISKYAEVIGDISSMDLSGDGGEITLKDTKTDKTVTYKVTADSMTLQRDANLCGEDIELVTPLTTTYNAGQNKDRHNAPLNGTRLGSGIWISINFEFAKASSDKTSYDPRTDRTDATPGYNTLTADGLKITKDRNGEFGLCASEMGNSPKSGVKKTVNDFSLCISSMSGDGMKAVFGKNRFSLKFVPVDGKSAARLFIDSGTDLTDTGKEISFGQTYNFRFITSAEDDTTARGELCIDESPICTAYMDAAAAYRLDSFHIKYLLFENTKAEVLLKSWRMLYLKAEGDNTLLKYTGLTEKQQQSMISFEERIEKIYPWLASLYDKDTGGFYMAVSGRDDATMQPALEMTFFALNMIKGYSDCWSGLPDTVKQKFINFIIERQDSETGLFIDKQGKVNDRETSRNQNAVIGWVKYWEISLPYTHPSLNNTPAASVSNARAVRLLAAANNATSNSSSSVIPDYLETTETYKTWINSWDWENNSWTAGDQTSNSLTYLAYLDDSSEYKKVLLEILKEKQYQDTGLWSSKLDFNSISGAFKVSLIYQQLGVQMPNADKVIESTSKCMATYKPDRAHYARNPISLLHNISLYGGSYETEARKAVFDNLDNILSWADIFSCNDGGYSMYKGKSMKNFGGVDGSHELAEGDVDSTLMILVMRTELYKMFDLDAPKIHCSDNYWDSFVE